MLQHLKRLEEDHNAKHECAKTYVLQLKSKTSLEYSYITHQIRQLCVCGDGVSLLAQWGKVASLEYFGYVLSSDFTAKLNTMTPQMDVTLKTKSDYLFNHHFLNAVTNGIIEKLFISLSEFQYNLLRALLAGIFPGIRFRYQ